MKGIQEAYGKWLAAKTDLNEAKEREEMASKEHTSAINRKNECEKLEKEAWEILSRISGHPPESRR